MAYDTIKLRSPSMDISVIEQIQQQCLRRSGVEMSTGEEKYVIFAGELSGSWDARISVIPKFDEFVYDERTGRTDLLTLSSSSHRTELANLSPPLFLPALAINLRSRPGSM